MREHFWKWLARFAFRRWAATQPPGRKPVGLPFSRDPDAPCHCYEPRPPRPGDFHDCLTDGHSLCRECCHRDPELDTTDLSPVGLALARAAARRGATNPDVIEIRLWGA